jgi:hypothetical protein
MTEDLRNPIPLFDQCEPFVETENFDLIPDHLCDAVIDSFDDPNFCPESLVDS